MEVIIMTDNTRVWLNSAISTRLLGNESLDNYSKELEKLREVASQVAPEGRLVTFLASKSEKFRPMEKLVANIAISKTLYNERAITSNPEISIELGELIKHVNEINKIIDKRKAKNKPKRRKNNEQKKEVE
jgi:hypothetical protein